MKFGKKRCIFGQKEKQNQSLNRYTKKKTPAALNGTRRSNIKRKKKYKTGLSRQTALPKWKLLWVIQLSSWRNRLAACEGPMKDSTIGKVLAVEGRGKTVLLLYFRKVWVKTKPCLSLPNCILLYKSDTWSKSSVAYNSLIIIVFLSSGRTFLFLVIFIVCAFGVALGQIQITKPNPKIFLMQVYHS